MKFKELIILSLLTFWVSSYSQIRKSHLNGEWITENDKNIFYKNDTIRFYKYSEYSNSNNCNRIIWKIKNRILKTKKIKICSEPSRVSEYNEKEKIKIKKTDFGQVLEVYLNNKLVDKFRIIAGENQRYLKKKKKLNN